ncbi:MAG: ATP-binding protein [Bryobacterales bacterium]|nr:ATP-binding protein [Bryobacterales bacterium]
MRQTNRTIELGLTSPVAAMEAFLETHRAWIESVVGCPRGEALTFEFDFPFSHVVLEQLMEGVHLDRQCLGAADALRPMVRRWETPPGCSPRIDLTASRDRHAKITERKLAWDPHWKETPIAVWLDGAEHAVVSANIPYVSFIEKGAISVRQWVIVNRREAAMCLNMLRQIEPPRVITMVGGRDIPLPKNGYNWDSVLLDPALNELVRQDFETFWDSESWFVQQHLPYRRGFLLYGPPGNGKTTVARIMACHPQVSTFSIDFSCEGLPNDALSGLFHAAEDNAPALIILEDLDRVFGAGTPSNQTGITLQHLLGCLDGLATQNGIVVVATANDPTTLDAAILKRPGRFDRLAAFPVPSLEMRRLYFHRLVGETLDGQSIATAARETDRMSFAQLREAYILAGQRSFRRGGGVEPDELLSAIRTVRAEADGVSNRSDGRSLGFGSKTPSAESPAAVCRRGG